MKKADRTTQTFTKHLMIIILLAAIFFVGCNKDEDPIPDPAPDIPPKSTMIMDFSDFTHNDTTILKLTYSHQHWGWAAANIVIWNGIIAAHMAVPIASFHEAFNHEGVFDPDTDTWVWSYNFIAENIMHLAQLHASVVNEGIEWEMYISKNNHFSDFLWYSGISNSTNTQGYWSLSKTPQNPTDFIYIEWNRDPEGETANIKYTNVIPEHVNNGSYIHYGINNDLPYNAFYNIYSVSHENMNNIEWNRVTKEGRIRDAMHFGDFDWRCWDTALFDSDCE